ncbi:hypothetical protein CA85_08660 [Allorhodopirellula solitaria]|uniref:Uncharacterized protein n=2 Tax=Allorhodopirellula solitaria TaxID=2527987 RepID=A0A5C5YGF0_9BACT|nr:hypothetical protein CA85_08660 [Allorhodopirellula solitaria]
MLRIFPLAVFFVILLGVCAPRSVQASCGDWLQHADSMQDTEEAATAPAPAEPCHGPACGQSPTGKDPLPAIPGIERHHHDAALLCQERVMQASLDAQSRCGDRLLLPSGYRMAIERPPQS